MQPILYLSGAFIAITILTEIIELQRNDLNKEEVNDIYNNIFIGVFFMAMGLSFRGLVLVSLSYLHEFSFFKIAPTWYQWIFIFLLLDLIHYWVHFLEHNVRVFWAIHSVHHSSEHYNYSTAIRGPLGTAFYLMVYSAPLCLIGFEPLNVILVDQLILLYAFFLHTEKVKKLGILEYFMSTPSHHRVHHGANDEYLDKNFGACLIIWDKLFGTFKSENVKPVYGIRSPMNDLNPILIITHEWSRLIRDVKSTNDFRNWFNFIFNKPNWSPSPINERHNGYFKIRECLNQFDCFLKVQYPRVKIRLSFTVVFVVLLQGCQNENDVAPAKCTTGYTEYPGFCDMPGGCGGYYEDCGQPYVPSGLVYSFDKMNKTSIWDEQWFIGDTIKFRLSFTGNGDNSFDLVEVKLCDGLLDFEVSFKEVQKGLEKRFIIGDNQEIGIHKFELLKGFKNGGLKGDQFNYMRIYPKLVLPTSCSNPDKQTIVVYAPVSTPDTARIQIRKYGSVDWKFENDSSYYLTKIDDFRYCISLDFRENEQYYFLRDGDESKCTLSYGTIYCLPFVNLPDHRVVVWSLLSWSDDDSLPPIKPVCEP